MMVNVLAKTDMVNNTNGRHISRKDIGAEDIPISVATTDNNLVTDIMMDTLFKTTPMGEGNDSNISHSKGGYNGSSIWILGSSVESSILRLYYMYSIVAGT